MSTTAPPAGMLRTPSIARLRRTYTTALTTLEEPFKKGSSKRQPVLRALLWFAIVLLGGGAIFSALERDTEIEARRSLAQFLRKIDTALHHDRELFHELVTRLGSLDDRVADEMLRADLTPSTALPTVLEPYDWDFTGACFFCFTAATTIGYGNYTPQTNGGKAFLVFYAFLAIPACLNAFAEISDRALEALAGRFRRRMVFEKRIQQAFHMFDADRSGKLDRAEVRNAMRILGYKVDNTDHGIALTERFDRGFTACDPDGDNALDLDEFRSFVLTVAPDAAVKVELVLSKGYVVILAFCLFCAIAGLSTIAFSAFYVREEWSALDAFYFTIVTFTTIGFGDFSPDPHPGWFASIFIACTFFGLGITATLVRAASDPAFDLAATARGLAPRQWDAMLAGKDLLQGKLADAVGKPSWKPRAPHPIVNSREMGAVRNGFAAAVASAARSGGEQGGADAGADAEPPSQPRRSGRQVSFAEPRATSDDGAASGEADAEGGEADAGATAGREAGPRCEAV